jgi:hypothetical protein
VEGTCYKVHTEAAGAAPVDYANAKAKCEKKPNHKLAAPRTVAVMEKLVELSGGAAGEKFWVGLNDMSGLIT